MGARTLLFALLGGVLGLDVVSFPQIMISRPIVAATLSGALAGDALRGLVVGAALEMMAMETLPIGAARYPEWATASVVGGALFATSPAAAPGALLVAVLAAIITAWVGGWSMYALRRLNGRWVERARPALDAGSARTVVGLQLRGIVADFVRGVALTAVALAALAAPYRLVLARWMMNEALTRTVVVALAVAVAGSAAWKLAHGAPAARWYLGAGLLLGLACAAAIA